MPTVANTNELAFATSSKRGEPFDFTVDDRTYTFTPPKLGLLVMSVLNVGGTVGDIDALRGMMEWLGAGLSDEDEAHIEGRLRDPDDDFDIEDLTNIFQGLVVKVAGRPTTAPSGS